MQVASRRVRWAKLTSKKSKKKLLDLLTMLSLILMHRNLLVVVSYSFCYTFVSQILLLQEGAVNVPHLETNFFFISMLFFGINWPNILRLPTCNAWIIRIASKSILL